jgi:hypothetical protein
MDLIEEKEARFCAPHLRARNARILPSRVRNHLAVHSFAALVDHPRDAAQNPASSGIRDQPPMNSRATLFKNAADVVPMLRKGAAAAESARRLPPETFAALARDAVDILFNASGASAIQSHVPIQRCQRDIQALAPISALAIPASESRRRRTGVGLALAVN